MNMGISYSIRELLLLILILAFWQGIGQTHACPALSIPANGSTDVALDVNFEWVASELAESYILIAGTSSGATNILDNINVGNVTEYELANMLPAGQTIFVRIIPENANGQNGNCAEVSFTTTMTQAPDCVALQVPMNGAVDVVTNAAIEWLASSNTLGYRITIGSSSGSNDIVDELDVGNATSYQLPGGFGLGSSVFLTITPYNASGSNTNCSEFNFTIIGRILPKCTQIINPQNSAQQVPTNTNITWIRELDASGYLMTIRKNEPNGEYILNEENIGNNTSFEPPNLEPLTKYFLTITPFNSQGKAENCETSEFTTGDSFPVPDCANWIFPANGDSNLSLDALLEWSEVPDSDGFVLSIGTSLDGAEILDTEDVGNKTSVSLPEGIPRGTILYAKVNTYKGDKVSEACPLITFSIENTVPMDMQKAIPKFFTPNNDGSNDLWKVVSTEGLVVEKVYIFDRYGKLLKQLGDSQGWDGTVNGQSLPASSYWYSVELLNAPRLTGYFMLKR